VKKPAIDITTMPGCFDGVIPPVIATCSAQGVPNLTAISQLYPVDECHVALSNQFFSKTIRNLAENPRASVLVTDSQTGSIFRLSLRFDHRETSGALFEELRASIDAIAEMMHATGVFKLRAADVYQVLECAHLSGPALTR
jgi:predicted pyridoxine 5'-phosphate oxidase superfamily flavin-nucleotide-binding protein